MKKIIFIICFISYLPTTMALVEKDLPYTFKKLVSAKVISAGCDAQKGDERGPFGITYREGKVTHTFLVLTGVYYDRCKTLEKEINQLSKKYTKLIITGTEPQIHDDPNEIIWRWRSLTTKDKKVCISYFDNDCPNRSQY